MASGSGTKANPSGPLWHVDTPLLEALGLTEVTHDKRNDKMKTL